MKILTRNFLFGSLGLIFMNNVSFASDCTLAPDCSSLGYTKSSKDCDGLDTVKCPFDNTKMACFGSSSSQSSAGKILYGDGTVSDTIVSGKKPIGVVFDEGNRLAVALTDVKQNGSAGSEKMYWSSAYCDTPNLENCSQEQVLTCATDGRTNTNTILASTCNGTTYAANAVNAYQTSNCSASFCQKGKWFLPSIKELNDIYSAKDKINNTLTSLSAQGATTFKNTDYWSSTENAKVQVWPLDMSNGSIYYANKPYYTTYVRPVVKF